MKQILVALALLITPQVTLAGRQPTTSNRSKTVSKRVPKGFVVRKNRAKLKPGYRFVRKSPNLMVVESVRKGLVAQNATFSCYCKDDEGATCSVTTQGVDLWCEGGCGHCVLKVTLEPDTMIIKPSKGRR